MAQSSADPRGRPPPSEGADPSAALRRTRLAAAATLLGAAFILWLSSRMSRPAQELARAPDPGATTPPGTGAPSWTPSPGVPLSATAGPQRALSGDWNLSDPRVDRTLVRPPDEQPEPPREAHAIPRAPLGGLWEPLAPLGGPQAVRAMLPAARGALNVPAAAPAASSATATLQTALPATQPKERPRRIFIPIPDPAAHGVREARERPVYKTEPTVASTTDGSTPPAGIALDPNIAVALVDKEGDGRLTPLPKGIRRGKPPASQFEPPPIHIDSPNPAVVTGVERSSAAARGSPPAAQSDGRPQRSIGR